MKNSLFTGVCTALVTPLLDNQVNYPLVEQLIQKQIQSGVKAIVLAGTTGEAPTLSDEEKIKLFQKGKQYAKDRCLIIAGTGSNSTKHAVELSIAAEKAGADALLVVSPYYNKGNPEGLFTHFMAIAQSVNIPIILYNVPSRTGQDIPVSLYRSLCQQPNIIGVKEASTDISKYIAIQNACQGNFSIWSGNDELTVPAISLGGSGVISVLSNLFPAETVAMTQAALDGDFDTAAALQCALMPIIQLLFKDVNPIPVKYAMQYVGFDCGGCRLPLGQISADVKEKIDKFFQQQKSAPDNRRT